jgi:heat shock protein HtpX
MARWGALFGGYGSSADRGRGNHIVTLLLTAVLAPIAATVVQMAVSRSREFAADATGARFAGQPYGLSKALEKLDG